LESIEKLILEEYEDVKKNGVTPEEVSRAKALLKTDALFTRDGAFSVAASVNEGRLDTESRF
jgi:zinc protease